MGKIPVKGTAKMTGADFIEHRVYICGRKDIILNIKLGMSNKYINYCSNRWSKNAFYIIFDQRKICSHN